MNEDRDTVFPWSNGSIIMLSVWIVGSVLIAGCSREKNSRRRVMALSTETGQTWCDHSSIASGRLLVPHWV